MYLENENYNGGKDGNEMTEKEFLFVKDISRLFRISENTVRRKKWREKSGIPLRKIGKQLCGSRTEIEKWFKKLKG